MKYNVAVCSHCFEEGKDMVWFVGSELEPGQWICNYCMEEIEKEED